MNPEPRQRDDYSDRQVEAARRVLVDLGQVLAAFMDCVVVVGGWTPDLLLPEADEPHVGSIAESVFEARMENPWLECMNPEPRHVTITVTGR